MRFNFSRTGQRLVDNADARARSIGPVIDELKAKGLGNREVVAELNRRGYRGAKGGPVTIGVLHEVLRRWQGLQTPVPLPDTHTNAT
ncbi:MAG: hypothetical protein OXC31_11080 [Spirochaetaceae bacterium]|nr:hypothetical protein [Spirochaetaceae bacterium]